MLFLQQITQQQTTVFVYGPSQAKKCLRTCVKFRSSCAYSRYHPGHCSLFIHSVVANDSVRGLWRVWSDCADARSDLGLHCMPEDTFSHGAAHTWLNPFEYKWAVTGENVPSDMYPKEDTIQPAQSHSLIKFFRCLCIYKKNKNKTKKKKKKKKMHPWLSKKCPVKIMTRLHECVQMYVFWRCGSYKAVERHRGGFLCLLGWVCMFPD